MLFAMIALFAIQSLYILDYYSLQMCEPFDLKPLYDRRFPLVKYLVTLSFIVFYPAIVELLMSYVTCPFLGHYLMRATIYTLIHINNIMSEEYIKSNFLRLHLMVSIFVIRLVIDFSTDDYYEKVFLNCFTGTSKMIMHIYFTELKYPQVEKADEVEKVEMKWKID